MHNVDARRKTRGLILAALMVFSVFGGSIALAGTAAAANNATGGAGNS
ncbi:MAG: surface glycoprotein [Halobacteriales archaeon]|nr:surface glycoprotein [Halobacteriales archaeon]